MTEDLNLVVFNRGIIEEFRANEGKVGGMFEGKNLVLLTTTGAKSGLPRVSPMEYIPDDDRIVVISSNGGADTHSTWFHNLAANPDVTVEVGTDRYPATAKVVEGAERDRLYARMAEVDPLFVEYEAKTSRTIPVVALYRATT